MKILFQSTLPFSLCCLAQAHDILDGLVSVVGSFIDCAQVPTLPTSGTAAWSLALLEIECAWKLVELCFQLLSPQLIADHCGIPYKDCIKLAHGYATKAGFVSCAYWIVTCNSQLIVSGSLKTTVGLLVNFFLLLHKS
jgi:hypothetical protein